jgi:hypothetical protein
MIEGDQLTALAGMTGSASGGTDTLHQNGGGICRDWRVLRNRAGLIDP